MSVVGLVLAVVVVAGGGDRLTFGDRIAVLEIDGLIADDAAVLEDLDRFRRDGSVKGYLVSINSPGGVVGPSQSVYRELRRIRDGGTPVVAAIGALGASGGYYVALAADTIFALPGSITGSIGVIMEFPNVRELMDRVGVEMEVIKSSEHKDMGSPFRSMSDGDRALLADVVADVYDQFVEAVVEERALPEADVRQVADGRVLSGRQALERGLVDRIGNERDALATVGRMAGLGDRPRVVRPPEPELSLLDLVLQGPAGLSRVLDRSVERLRWPSLSYVIH